MTLAHGIRRENPADNKTAHLFRKGEVLQLLADFSIDSDRRISGVAHVPVIDRENELILSDAVRKALPEYMKLPILHVQHTERPVGTVTKAYVDDEGDLYIEGEIKDTGDTDDVWSDILAGNLSKFSIFGKRTEASPECALAPQQRTNPCVTKALVLYSISVVGDNAMNQETFLEVAKAYGSDAMEEEEKEEDVEKCGVCKEDPDVEKSEQPPSELVKDDRNVSGILERLGKLEEVISKLVESDQQVHSMNKGEEEEDMKEDKKEEVEKAEPVEETVIKAEVVETLTSPDYVVKADLTGFITKAELDTITKAQDELRKAFDDMKSRVDKMERETIEKGGNIVVIAKEFLEDNPQMANYRAIGE